MNIPKTKRKAREMSQLVKVLAIEPDGMYVPCSAGPTQRKERTNSHSCPPDLYTHAVGPHVHTHTQNK